jgi:hypothetical protein
MQVMLLIFEAYRWCTVQMPLLKSDAHGNTNAPTSAQHSARAPGAKQPS